MPFTNTAKGGWNATTWLSADWFYQNCLFVMNEQYRPYKSNKNTILLWNSKIKVGGLSELDLSCHEWLLCSTCWLQGENLPPIPVHVSCAFSSRTLFSLRLWISCIYSFCHSLFSDHYSFNKSRIQLLLSACQLHLWRKWNEGELVEERHSEKIWSRS